MRSETMDMYSKDYKEFKTNMKIHEGLISDNSKEIKKIKKEIARLEETLKKAPNKDAIEKKIEEKRHDIFSLKSEIEAVQFELLYYETKLKDCKKELIGKDSDLRGYIEYAKADKYDQMIDRDKKKITTNNKTLNVLNKNPELKKLAGEYMQKIEDLEQFQKAKAKANAERKNALADAIETDEIFPTEVRISELESDIEKYIENLNSKGIRTVITKEEVLKTLKDLPLITKEDGSIDFDEAVETNNKDLEKNVDRNTNLLDKVVEEAYEEHDISLEGFNNAKKIDDIINTRRMNKMTREEYIEDKFKSVEAELKRDYGLDKPAEKKSIFTRLLHPIKTRKEAKDMEDKMNEYDSKCQEAKTKIEEEFDRIKAEQRNKRTNAKRLGREDFNSYSLGYDTKEFADNIIKEETDELER